MKPFRPVYVALIAGWLLVALAGFGHLWLVFDLDDLGCEHSIGDSRYGELSWSVLPPGPRCTWNEAAHGINDSEGPGPGTSVWIVSLALLGFGARKARGPGPGSAAPVVELESQSMGVPDGRKE